MTTLVTAGRYAILTGDTGRAASAVDAALDQAVDLIDEHLDRWLESAQRTEFLPLHQVREGSFFPGTSMRVYPKGYPITDVIAPDGAILVPGSTRWIQGVTANPPDDLVDIVDSRFASVTYEGGYTSATLPRTLERAICDLANALLRRTDLAGVPEYPDGATSIRLGDAAVTLSGVGGTGGTVDDLVAGMAARLRPYRNWTV